MNIGILSGFVSVVEVVLEKYQKNNIEDKQFIQAHTPEVRRFKLSWSAYRVLSILFYNFNSGSDFNQKQWS